MPPRSPRSRALTLLFAASLVVPVDAVAQDLDTVEERVGDLTDDVADATAAYEDVWARVNAAEDELAELTRRRSTLEQELAVIARSLEERARALFMQGPDSVLMSLLTADGPQRAIERASLMSVLTSRDRSELEAAANLRMQLGQARTLLADRAAELDLLRAELEANKDALEAQLRGAQTLAQDLRERAARQRRIDRGSQQGVYACIFERGTSHFRNTWGAPRSGGRRHKGTDVFSWMDAPVFAITDGRVHRVTNSRLGGLGLYLYGTDGNLYYYAHLNRIADGVHVGQRVEAGQLVAHNGDTGNARGGPPHVHFELHPGGGAPTNPYEWLAAACF